MNYQIGAVTLHSQDKNRMLDFLSDVLEFDIDSDNDSLAHGALLFKLCEDKNRAKQEPGVEFNFSVKSEDALQEIVRKYNFFIYRKPSPQFSSENLLLENKDELYAVTIEDIDRRRWRFELHSKNVTL